MFIDEKAAGEVQTKLKLSEAIRIGHPMIDWEDRYSYRHCALGCAWAAIKGRQIEEGAETLDLIAAGGGSGAAGIAKALGFPHGIARLVSRMHHGGKSALQIADWLEAQGY